jgi:hypothetical protein
MKTILDIWVEDHGVQVEYFTDVVDKHQKMSYCEFSDRNLLLDDTVLIRHRGTPLKILFSFLNLKTSAYAVQRATTWQFAKEYVCITPQELKAKIALGLVTPNSYYFNY